MSDAALAEIAGAAFTRLHGDGGVAARSATSQAASSAAAIDRCCSLDWRRESTTGQTSHMVLSPGSRFAAVDDAVRAFADHQVQFVERQALGEPGDLRGANEEGAEQRAAGTADVGEQRHAGVFEDKANIFIGNRRQFSTTLLKPRCMFRAVIGIADLFIEAGEKIALFGEDIAAAVQPVDDLRSVQ